MLVNIEFQRRYRTVDKLGVRDIEAQTVSIMIQRRTGHSNTLLAVRMLAMQQQRRTFLGLQRPPAPKPHMMGYLVAQGLAIVLAGDYAIATLMNEPTTVRSIFQLAGLCKDTPAFEKVHHDVVKSTVEK